MGGGLCRDRSVSFEEDAEEDDEVELEKSNVLLMGPTGSGMDSTTGDCSKQQSTVVNCVLSIALVSLLM